MNRYTVGVSVGWWTSSERTGHTPSYAEAMKWSSLRLRTHGCLSARLRDYAFRLHLHYYSLPRFLVFLSILFRLFSWFSFSHRFDFFSQSVFPLSSHLLSLFTVLLPIHLLILFVSYFLFTSSSSHSFFPSYISFSSFYSSSFSLLPFPPPLSRHPNLPPPFRHMLSSALMD